MRTKDYSNSIREKAIQAIFRCDGKVLMVAGKVLNRKFTNTQTSETAYIEITIENPALKNEEINLIKPLGH